MTATEQELLNILLSEVRDGEDLYRNSAAFRTAAICLAQGQSPINLLADLSRVIQEKDERFNRYVEFESTPIHIMKQ